MDYLQRILHDVQCIMSFSPPQREVKRHLEGIKTGNQYERQGYSLFKKAYLGSEKKNRTLLRATENLKEAEKKIFILEVQEQVTTAADCFKNNKC